MANDPAAFRPGAAPSPEFPSRPEFPPRKVPAFARTPAAIFPALLGLLGLATALKAGLAAFGMPVAIADVAAGLALPLWAFGVFAYGAKIMRRPTVILDDLKIMPSRSGLSAASIGGMIAAGLLVPFTTTGATVLLFAALLLHGVMAGLTIRTFLTLSPPGREVNPGWLMSFAGFIVGAPAAAALGYDGLAQGLLYATVPVAVSIWGVSLVQLRRRVPPAPLRPMLAIHLAPASLFAISATLTGQSLLAGVFLVATLGILLALTVSLHWISVSGFSPLWGAFTFPLSAAATALLLQGGVLAWVGLFLLSAALAAIPWIAWRILSLWPGGHLASKTNAAEA
jgi:tellurite resistance protein